jgi:long-chain acyl-CoA synthetase
VDFVEALPKAPTGKILKRELRDPYWQVQERSV